jgi:hypothetical protein
MMFATENMRKIHFGLCRKFVEPPHLMAHMRLFDRFEEAPVSNHAIADVATKAVYFSLAAASLIFVALLVLTALHP